MIKMTTVLEKMISGNEWSNKLARICIYGMIIGSAGVVITTARDYFMPHTIYTRDFNDNGIPEKYYTNRDGQIIFIEIDGKPILQVINF